MLFRLLALAACNGASSDSTGGSGEGDTDTDADSDTDTDTDTDTDVGCTKMSEGHWALGGSCFGMAMSATLTLDKKDSCAFTFSDWNMAMESPGGGSVSGTTLTLSGDGGWDTCTGKTDGTSAAGSCPDRASCVFEMTK